jgi:hypothetical protein
MTMKLVIFIALTVIVASCFLDSDDDLTIVKGKIINKIDDTPLSGIPVELSICSGGFNHDGCDSLKTVYTDAQGNYEMNFRTKRKRFYKIGLPLDINFEHNYQSLIVNEGKTNTVDFQLIPLVILKLNLKTDKGAKNYLYIDVVRGQCANGSYDGYASTVFLDTSRTTQSIDTIQYLSVSPLCEYHFRRNLCNRTGIYDFYKYTDCTNYETMQTVHVEYVDTTTINLN